MSGYTPGPWEAEDVDVFAHGTMICDCAWGYQPETCISNARLIAAAPEMYAALKEWMDLPTTSPLDMTPDQRRRLFANFQSIHAIFAKVDAGASVVAKGCRGAAE